MSEKEVKMYTVTAEDQNYQVADVAMFNAAIDAGYPAPIAADIVNQGLAYLKILGEVVCATLDFAPSHELILPWPVNANCTLEMVVRKK